QQPPLEALRGPDDRDRRLQRGGQALDVGGGDDGDVELGQLLDLTGEDDGQRHGVAVAQFGDGHADAGDGGDVGRAFALGDEDDAGAGDGGDAGVELQVAGGGEHGGVAAGGALGLDAGD